MNSAFNCFPTAGSLRNLERMETHKAIANNPFAIYLACMSDWALFIAAIAVQAIFVFVFLKLLPGAIMKFADKEIERRSDIKLEKVKGEIQGSYSALKSSMELLTASNSGLHPHIIGTVEELWGLVVKMKHDFSGMVTFDSIFLAGEAAEAFKDEGAHANLIAYVEKHRDEFQNLHENGAVLEQDLDKHRLFSGDRLWLIFFVVRAVYMRSSLLIARSFQEHDYVDWRKDDGIRQLLTTVLPVDVVEKITARTAGGLSAAIDQLEARFLHEATRVMSGSKSMSDSLADMQSILLLENAKIAGK